MVSILCLWDCQLTGLGSESAAAAASGRLQFAPSWVTGGKPQHQQAETPPPDRGWPIFTRQPQRLQRSQRCPGLPPSRRH